MNKKELIELAKSLGASDEVLKGKTNKELSVIIAELKAKQEDKSTKDGDLKDDEPESKSPEGDGPDEDPEETTPVDYYTDNRGISWRFKKSAPKTIRFDGRVMTQEDILTDEAVIAELVYGNSNLLTKKN